MHISFPAQLAEGLAEASPEDLTLIEITPSGLGLHGPRLDADLSVPGILAGEFGAQADGRETRGGGRARAKLRQDGELAGKSSQRRPPA